MKYNFIFSGSGLSTLIVLYEMLRCGDFTGKKIMVIEPVLKNANDKTWCFWETGNGDWDFLVKKQWERALFIHENAKIECLSGSLRYKMIASETLYQTLLKELQEWNAITWVTEKVVSHQEFMEEVIVTTNKSKYTSDFFINSAPPDVGTLTTSRYPLLQQHFVGWFVKTKSPSFDSNVASFMDFSIAQESNTRFMYVLPISATEALVEYTLFSPNTLEKEVYENAIQLFLRNKGITDFDIVAKEQGNIPMTVYPFWNKNSKRVLNIGTAGGWTKASTGFTFKNTTKKAKSLVAFMNKEVVDFSKFHKKSRFLFYDALFVSVLFRDNALGKQIFSNMFEKVHPEKILRFLDEESTFLEELEIILACPKIPFLKALFRFFSK